MTTTAAMERGRLAQRRRRRDFGAGKESGGARDVARTRRGERRGSVGVICALGTEVAARAVESSARAASAEAALA